MPKFSARKRSIVALVVPLGVAVLLIFFPPVFNLAKAVSLKVVTAPVVVFNSAVKYFRSRRSLDRENFALKAKVTELSLELARAKGLVAENRRLKDLLDLKEGLGYETISAEVIARDPNNWIGSFTVNKGSGNGIKKGAAVCSSKGLVGRVADVYPQTSLVMLVTHPGFRAGGMLVETGLNGVVEGDGKGHARLLYLPLDSEVRLGQTVVTSGHSREFPKGVVIGRVISVEKNATGLFKNAVLKPEASAYEQDEVICLK
ncbi:MAG TPA: rod shape-determining protein MreC [Candidatus Omnitrophota bacterium]|nr:rod shape-determining protein MreC [Candidatus Omnitrophota bacterium]